MDAVPRAELRAERGIVGNAEQGGRRQITLLEQGAWEAVIEELAHELEPAARRANLLVSGLPLAESRGKILRVGACRLQINGETRPCARMDEALPGLRRVLSVAWRGGVFAEVLDDGVIEVGVRVEWVNEGRG